MPQLQEPILESSAYFSLIVFYHMVRIPETLHSTSTLASDESRERIVVFRQFIFITLIDVKINSMNCKLNMKSGGDL